MTKKKVKPEPKVVKGSGSLENLIKHCVDGFVCADCGEKDHVTRHHIPGVEGFVCYRCAEAFKTNVAQREVCKKSPARTPIHESYLVVEGEGRGAMNYVFVYVKHFAKEDETLNYVSQCLHRIRHVFKLTSDKPITVEELNLDTHVTVKESRVINTRHFY